MKIAAYCRVSTDKEEQQDSLENQKLFFNEYANRNGHTLVKLYADEGISGTRLRKRDEFMRLIKDAKLGLFEMVVVKDVSRFARNTVDFLQSIRYLKSLGIVTLFITANMDSLGDSEFVLTMFGAIAQEESANLSKRVKFGKKITGEKGRVPIHVYGYEHVDNYTLKIIDEEAKVVREIFDLYLKNGLGCRTISLELNRRGYKTKFGYDWNPRGVRRILTNSIYCGRYVNHKYEVANYLDGKLVPVPKDQQFHHDRPEWAIISEEVFDAATRQLNERRKKYTDYEPFREARYSSKFIFSTMIKCEHCGRSFCRKHYRKSPRVTWVCTTNDQLTSATCDNRVKLVESELLAEIKSYLASIISDKDKFIRDILGAMENDGDEERISVDDLEAKKKKLTVKKERYQEMFANDIITMDELKKRATKISEEIREIDYQLGICTKKQDLMKSTEESAMSYIKEIERFLNMETVTNADFRKIVERIVVNRDGMIKVILKDLSNQDNSFAPI